MPRGREDRLERTPARRAGARVDVVAKLAPLGLIQERAQWPYEDWRLRLMITRTRMRTLLLGASNPMTLPHRPRSRTDAPAGSKPANAPSSYRAWLIAAEGLGLMAVIGSRGTPGWQALRMILVLAIFTAAVSLQRSERRWLSSTTSVIVGLVGVIAGVAVGVMQLVKSGPPITMVGGLVALASGLLLLAVGAVALIALLPRWWRLVSIPAAYLLIELVVFPVAGGVYAANAPAGHLGKATPASYGLASTDVSFTTPDGVRLAGWYVPSHNGAAVVVVPGSGSTRAATLSQGSVLARHGYGVLFVDHRGHGTSGGTAMDFGWWGERDLSGAVSFLEGRPEVNADRIAILGESMGGEEAIGAIGSDRRVRAVIAEGVTGRTAADTARLGGGLTAEVARVQSWISDHTAGLLSRAPRPAPIRTSLRRAAPRSVLIISGHDEIAAGRYFRAGSPHNVQLVEMPDTEHTSGLRTHPRAWERAVIDFLTRNL